MRCPIASLATCACSQKAAKLVDEGEEDKARRRARRPEPADAACERVTDWRLAQSEEANVQRYSVLVRDLAPCEVRSSATLCDRPERDSSASHKVERGNVLVLDAHSKS